MYIAHQQKSLNAEVTNMLQFLYNYLILFPFYIYIKNNVLKCSGGTAG